MRYQLHLADTDHNGERKHGDYITLPRQPQQTRTRTWRLHYTSMAAQHKHELEHARHALITLQPHEHTYTLHYTTGRKIQTQSARCADYITPSTCNFQTRTCKLHLGSGVFDTAPKHENPWSYRRAPTLRHNLVKREFCICWYPPRHTETY